MPPPIPLSGAAAWYSAGSQSGSASSSANRGRSGLAGLLRRRGGGDRRLDVRDERTDDCGVENELLAHGARF